MNLTDVDNDSINLNKIKKIYDKTILYLFLLYSVFFYNELYEECL